jgi:polyhydroxyalkanoate synthesis regulator phasin
MAKIGPHQEIEEDYEEIIEDLLDNDEISTQEAAFMQGYNAA